MKKLVIASRGSKLALWQAEHIRDVLKEANPNLDVEIETYKTQGDKILDVPLAKIGGKGLFTKELEESMKNGQSHIAVHSLKDVPVVFEDGFVLAAVTKREDIRDALLSQKYSSIEDLPPNAVVGTTSLRRRMQLLTIRKDLIIKDLRGNVNTRIQKLKDGQYDAIILAYAGMKRLELTNEVNFCVPISEDLMIPAMGQAALGIECLDNKEVIDLLSVLADRNSTIETTVERDFIRRLEGGCQVPIGINAKVTENRVKAKVMLGMPDGSEILKDELSCDIEHYEMLGTTLAEIMINKGAKELLEKALNSVI